MDTGQIIISAITLAVPVVSYLTSWKGAARGAGEAFGGLKADVETLKEQDRAQWLRMDKLEEKKQDKPMCDVLHRAADRRLDTLEEKCP